MVLVIRCGAINARYFDSEVYRRTFKILTPQCSRNDFCQATVGLLKPKGIVSIEISDVFAVNVVSTDSARDILTATESVLI